MPARFIHTNQTTAELTEIIFSRAPLRPPISLERIQPKEQSAADVPFVYDSLTDNDLINLTLRLTSIERSSLEPFFVSIVRGQSDRFIYADVAGVAKSVKFNQSMLEIREIAYNSHTVTVSLRVQP